MSTVCEFSGQKNAVLYHTVSTICEFSGQKNAVLYHTVSTICEFSGQKNAVYTKLCQQYANFQVKRTLFIPNCVNNMRIFRSKERCLYQTVSTICEFSGQKNAVYTKLCQQYANFQGNPLSQATKQHLNNSDTVKNDNKWDGELSHLSAYGRAMSSASLKSSFESFMCFDLVLEHWQSFLFQDPPPPPPPPMHIYLAYIRAS